MDEQGVTAPTLDMIRDAACALEGIIVRTPLLENADVNDAVGLRLLIKAETAQRTGAFKLRGAYNRIRQLSAAERARGVIAYSSGNHAQAVACAANMVGTQATIVMPDDAPATKISRTRALGAEVITYDRAAERREDVADRLQRERNLVLVPPGEDARVMAGAGTVALEMVAQARAARANLDTVLVPCGGGGLSAATAIVLESLSPQTKVLAVEPELFDDTRRSIAAGKRVANPPGRTTICDSIMTDMPGPLTFSINKTKLSRVLTVSDDEVCAAMKVGFDQFKTVVEPGAAVGLAAVLAGKIDPKKQSIGIVLTGGNVDAADFCKAYRRAEGGSDLV
jgi:threonine dehydratase